MPTDMPELADQLRTIAESARLLRDAGITGTVKVGDVEFTLEPPELPATQSSDQPTSTSALDDPATYGLRPGTSAPVFFTDPRRKA